MDIHAELESARTPPVAAMRAAVGEAAAIAPDIIALVEMAAEGVYLLPSQDRLLFYGLPVLAAARHAALYQPLTRLLRRPETELDRLLGDAVTETVPRILVSVFDGDPDPLIAAIEDRGADGIVRWGMFDVLARLTFEGAIARETAFAVIERFDRERLADDGDAAWEGWQNAVMLLGLDGLADRVRAAWEDGRSPQREVDKRDWEERLRDACADPANPGRFEHCRVDPIDDPATAFAWLEAADDRAEPEPVTDADRPEDPAAQIALDDDETDWLAGFLECSQTPATTMPLEELDGFFTALVVGPDTVLPSRFIPELWGTPDGEGPVFDSDEQMEYAIALLMRHWNTIATRLAGSYPHIPWVPWGSDGMEWSLGFLRGVEVRMESWKRLLDDREFAGLLGPVVWLAGSETRDAEADSGTDDHLDILERLTLATVGLYDYWRDREQQVGRRPVRRAPKIGRNEPCPCGSGKKYKRCCGSPAASVSR